jgi:DNA/RNA-binding domain of Phe-tRNA-synthetase-like protein
LSGGVLKEVQLKMFIVSETWKTTYPGAAAGFLVMGNVANPDHHPALGQRKEALENQLRSQFAGGDRAALAALPIIRAYNAYYKRFKKTYHVQLQLESVALKGRSIPGVAALVEAMFMAELKNLLLTAGHDLATVQGPVRLDVATGSERYTLLNGQAQVLKLGDMFMADTQGVISSVLYGPDQRTRITPSTRRVLFAVYAPPGIGQHTVREHLQDIRANVLLIAPDADVEVSEVYGTD